MKEVFLDVETGGLDPARNPLLSVGAVIDDDQFYVQIACDDLTSITPEAARINGMTVEDLKTGVPTKEAIDMLMSFFQKHSVTARTHTLVGINIGFDKAFLEANGVDNLPYRNIDLTTLARFHFNVGGSDQISEAVGINPEAHPHNALNGALQNKLIYERMKSLLLRRD